MELTGEGLTTIANAYVVLASQHAEMQAKDHAIPMLAQHAFLDTIPIQGESCDMRSNIELTQQALRGLGPDCNHVCGSREGLVEVRVEYESEVSDDGCRKKAVQRGRKKKECKERCESNHLGG
ncbi:hypothetical protein VNO78_03497 [Psophocarpus tetragonolobus]|uniref:Uncharacterized protein n=1 Tax=Psophocarpus tetragonolobus TaxID=3891 RepID=A0AAN9XVZ6_PSOTE